MDKLGNLFVIPIEAKSQADNDMIGRIQISQIEFDELTCRILPVKELSDKTIGIVEFNDKTNPDEVKILSISR